MKSKVGDLMVATCVSVHENDKITRVMRKIAEERKTTVACVVDDADKLKGIITPKRLLKAVLLAAFKKTREPTFEWGEVLSSLTTKYAKEIMEPVISVAPDAGVEDAIDLMLDKGLYDLPVVDKGGKLLGGIYFFDIIASWAKEHTKIHGTSMMPEHERWHGLISQTHTGHHHQQR